MSIVKDIESKIEIPTVVKLHKHTDQLELFYIDDHGSITSFCFSEGHNIACRNYMKSLVHVEQVIAEAFIDKYNLLYPTNVVHVYRKRLTKPKLSLKS